MRNHTRTITEALSPYVAKAVPKSMAQWPCTDGLSHDDCRKQHRPPTCPGAAMTLRQWYWRYENFFRWGAEG